MHRDGEEDRRMEKQVFVEEKEDMRNGCNGGKKE